MLASKRQVTIKQVAKEAGVSTQTISRVLNNRPDVATDTRRHVQEVINRLGYQPSAIARSLTGQQTRILGVALAELGQYGPMRRLMGMDQSATELGYSLHLSLVHQPEKPDHSEEIFNELLSWQVDGIIWAVPEIGANRNWLKEKMRQFPLPIIFVGGAKGPELQNVISIDNQAGGRMATEHLLARGYRHIGIVTGPMAWYEAKERLRGWQSAVPHYDNRQMVEGDWSSASGEQGLHQLLKQYPEIDAVFAGNDQMALGVLQAAHQLGLRVPEDLGVVGFDNTPEAPYFWPPLTTIRHQLFKQGELVVQRLVTIIEKGTAGKPAPSTPPQLIPRRSSGAV